MEHFRADNTEGYSTEQLYELNRRFEDATHDFLCLDKSIADSISERILAQFDTEN